jgi:hypothetical protein
MVSGTFAGKHRLSFQNAAIYVTIFSSSDAVALIARRPIIRLGAAVSNPEYLQGVAAPGRVFSVTPVLPPTTS